MRNVRLSFAAVIVACAALGAGCGPKLADCDAIAAEQPDCMNEDAKQDCIDTNDECVAVGGDEVLTLESCPLQFACSQTP